MVTHQSPDDNRFSSCQTFCPAMKALFPGHFEHLIDIYNVYVYTGRKKGRGDIGWKVNVDDGLSQLRIFKHLYWEGGTPACRRGQIFLGMKKFISGV